MEEVSDNAVARQRAARKVVFDTLDAISQKRVADLLNLSESALSAFKKDHLERACFLITACGLRIVPTTEQTYEEEDIYALRRLALRGIGHITPRGRE